MLLASLSLPSWLGLALLAFPVPQGGPLPSSTSPSTPQELQTQTQEALKALPEFAPDQEQDANREARQHYERAQQDLNKAKELRALTEQYKSDAALVPGRIDSLEQELASPLEAIPLGDLSEREDLKPLEEQWTQAKADLQKLLERKNKWEGETSGRLGRLSKLPDQIASAKQEVASAAETSVALTPEAKSGAQGTAAAAKAILASANQSALEAEQVFHEAQKLLDPLLETRFRRQELQLEQVVDNLGERVGELRTAQADIDEQKANQTAEDIQERYESLKPLAARNKKMTAALAGPEGLVQRNENAEAHLATSITRLETIIQRARRTAKRMDAYGLTKSMGRFLRNDFEWISSEQELRRQVQQQRELHSQCEMEVLDLEESDPLILKDAEILERFGMGTVTLDPSDPRSQLAQNLVDQYRANTKKVLEQHAKLQGTLAQQQVVQADIQTYANIYRSYIESRILWIRSASSVVAGGMNDLPVETWKWSTCWLRPTLWAGLGKAAFKNIGTTLLCTLLLLILIGGRRFLRRKRQEMHKGVRSRRTDRFLLTGRALMQSVLLSLWVPLILWYVGTLFTALFSDSSLVSGTGLDRIPYNKALETLPLGGMGNALREMASVLWVLIFVYELVREKGTGEVHFRWNAMTTALVRKQLRWFTPLVVTFGIIFRSLNSQVGNTQENVTQQLSQSDTVGRLAFCLAMAALAFFLRAVSHKESPIWTQTLQRKPGLMFRVHSMWTTGAVVIPVALIILALLGYYYTAIKLELLLRWSLLLGLVLALIHTLLLRWLNLTRWRLAVAQAKEKAKLRAQNAAQAAAQAKAQAATGDGPEAPQEVPAIPVFDESAVDLPALDTQTRQLFKSGITLSALIGLYFIWASALPALKGLDSVQLWPNLAIANTSQASELEDALPAQSGEPSKINQAPTGGSNGTPQSGSQETASSPTAITGSPTAILGAAPAPDTEPASGLPSTLTLGDVILAIIILALMMAAARNLPGLLEIALLQRLPMDSGSRYAVSTLVRYLIFIIGISAASSTLGLGWDRIQWLVAALTFGLAFGLQEIFANFVSGLIILLERPVRVGDVVTVGNTEGMITRLRMRATTVQDWDRRELLVPNKEFITSSVINWTLTDPITRIIVKVGIAYGSDVELARKILLGVAKENPYVVESPSPVVVFRSFGDSTLDFELRIFLSNRDNWPLATDYCNTAIDKAFHEAGIEIAFPQRDLHIRSGLEQLGHQVHGKSQTPE